MIVRVPSTHRPHYLTGTDRAVLPAMATAASSSRCRRGHGCFLHLVTAAAVLAAFGLGAARAEGTDRVLLNVASLFPGSSCATPPG